MQPLMQLTQQHLMRLKEQISNFVVHRLIPVTFSIQPLPIPSQHTFWPAPLFPYFHFLSAYPSSFADLDYSS
jgi:hypothetical protein